jgi:hypothetical protein
MKSPRQHRLRPVDLQSTVKICVGSGVADSVDNT